MSSAFWVFMRENAEFSDTTQKKAFGLALMLVQINYTANRLWIHPVNNLRFEASFMACTEITESMKTSSSIGTECRHSSSMSYWVW